MNATVLFYIAVILLGCHISLSMNLSLDSSRFYHLVESYHGHDVADLELVYQSIGPQASSVIFLAGDSSLDNKFWIRGDGRRKPAFGPYKEILTPPVMVADISYHLNVLGEQHRIVTINAAVEESTLRSRRKQLNQQDRFIQDNLRREDILVVSVGGNDVALSSTLATKYNMSLLIHFNSAEDLLNEPEHCWGMKHFVRMFKDDLQNYIERLTSKTRPREILVCMIYFPAEEQQGGWVDPVLSYLSYNTKPVKLQSAIRALFKIAVSQIKIEGSHIIPVPLFEALDGKTASDYIDRVEPSASGGLKIARLLFQLASLGINASS